MISQNEIDRSAEFIFENPKIDLDSSGISDITSDQHRLRVMLNNITAKSLNLSELG
jgi:hypothetical protein